MTANYNIITGTTQNVKHDSILAFLLTLYMKWPSTPSEKIHPLSLSSPATSSSIIGILGRQS